MLKITPNAITEIKRIQDSLGESGQPISLTVKSGGCCGLCYSFELSPTTTEQVWQTEGINLACSRNEILRIAPEAQPYVENLKIDYAEDLMGGAFRFENPQAQATCSCSQSFSWEC
ncbi:MAG: iron-sulfur cluster assembly accessory protein [Gloeocapsa sp. DLM2.Bin57]|nr:MAG: iron-sulfur cluster assembly accessory protein [Gloeocapsa sp. DLM2.Bin57]